MILTNVSFAIADRLVGFEVTVSRVIAQARDLSP
jgi:hypothetical protein